MSFSSEVKAELSLKYADTREGLLAELSALMLASARIYGGNRPVELRFSSEHEGILRKCFTILGKAFKIENVGSFSEKEELIIADEQESVGILKEVYWREDDHPILPSAVDDRLLRSESAKRAFLRGCFLASGSVSTPEKFYHLEYVCSTEDLAQQLISTAERFGIEARKMFRKKNFVVYVKESSQISACMHVMDAPKAVMNFENILILKDLRNRVNRGVNCETANLLKTTAASYDQIEAIEYLKKKQALDSLPDTLREAAAARTARPDASIAELGLMMKPPVGKSGMNHRLRKLKELAEDLGLTDFRQEGQLLQ